MLKALVVASALTLNAVLSDPKATKPTPNGTPKPRFVSNKPSTLQRFTINLSPQVRHATMEGRPYLVVPMVMLTEGVHSGSGGPLYYPLDEIERTPEVWNMKPVVVYHPQRDGQGISACDVDVVNSQKIGLIMNAKVEEGKLKAEAWLEEHRIKAVDGRVLEALEKKQVVELSTGLFTDNEDSEGDWNGESYTHIARNYRPDHLAILPDQKGACSVADGAGLLRNSATDTTPHAHRKGDKFKPAGLTANEISHDQVRERVQAALRAAKGVDSYCYVVDTFGAFFIYQERGELYRQGYTVSDTSATLVGEATSVVRVVQYRTPAGVVVGNADFVPETTVTHIHPNQPTANGATGTKPTGKEHTMNKAAIIAFLINAGTFTEAEKSFLETMDEKRLQGLMDSTSKRTEPTGNAAPALVTNNAGGNQPTREMTPEEFIAKAPAKFKGMLANGLRAFEAKRTALITRITGNARNKFKPERLASMEIEELENLAELATTPTENSGEDYSGLADALEPVGNDYRGGAAIVNNEPGLPLPTHDWSKR